MAPTRKERNEEVARWNCTTGVGIGYIAKNMVHNQKLRSTKKRRSSHIRNKEKARANCTTGVGIGKIATAMVHNQNTRIKKGRPMNPVDLEYCQKLLITKLIQQKTLCAVTNQPLFISGTNTGTPWDLFRLSPDRLNDDLGYSEDNVVLVCHWINPATSQCIQKERSILLQCLSQVQIPLPETPKPFDLSPLYLDPSYWEPEKCQWDEETLESFAMIRPPTNYKTLRPIFLEAFSK